MRRDVLRFEIFRLDIGINFDDGLRHSPWSHGIVFVCLKVTVEVGF